MEVTVVNIVLAFLIILVAISAHEMMHALVSYWLGDDTAHQQGRITLNPLPHIDPLLTIALPLFLISFGQPSNWCCSSSDD